jgi:hypothetical protein
MAISNFSMFWNERENSVERISAHVVIILRPKEAVLANCMHTMVGEEGVDTMVFATINT